MKKGSFPIYTVDGAYLKEGYKGEFLGIHRDDDGDPWTVTYLPCGAKMDSIFPERFEARTKLMRRIDYIEGVAWAHLAALSDLPFGTAKFPDTHRPAANALVELVKNA